MTIRIGTASWADKSLIDTGRFYPPDVTTAESRLGYYATQFPLVEIDSSYYAVPSVDAARLWAQRTPDGFVMNVKAFRLFTGHQTSPAVLPSDLRDALPSGLKLKSVIYYSDVPGELANELWERFKEALQPLREAGRLGVGVGGLVANRDFHPLVLFMFTRTFIACPPPPLKVPLTGAASRLSRPNDTATCCSAHHRLFVGSSATHCRPGTSTSTHAWVATAPTSRRPENERGASVSI
jgi:hypothetical protein